MEQVIFRKYNSSCVLLFSSLSHCSPLQVSIDAIALAQNQARQASLKIEYSIQSSIVQLGITLQVQRSYALANIESLDALQKVFELEAAKNSFVNPVMKRGLGQLSLYYKAMANDPEPKRVLEPFYDLLTELSRTDIIKDPQGYMLKQDTLQRKLEDATKNICNPKIIPVGHHSISAVIASTNNTIKYFTSSWSDLPLLTREALDRVSRAFARATQFQVELEVARCLLVETVYEGE